MKIKHNRIGRSSSEEFYYKDDSSILDMLEQVCDYVHTYMDMKRYKQGFEIS